MEEVMRALQKIRAPFTAEEKQLHQLAAAAFMDAGLLFEHEKTLSRGCRADFFINGVVVEVKNFKPNAKVLYAQLARYAGCGQVTGLVVLCRRGVPLPDKIAGKPVCLVDLQRLWGVTV